MSANVLTYRGFQGSIEVSIEDDCMFGKILHVEDLVTYEGGTPGELKAAFENSVNEYLAFCEEQGVEPCKPFKGSLNVRLGQVRHAAAAKKSALLGVSLNEYICNALDAYEEGRGSVQEIHHHEHKHSHVLITLPKQSGVYDYAEEHDFSSWSEQYGFGEKGERFLTRAH